MSSKKGKHVLVKMNRADMRDAVLELAHRTVNKHSYSVSHLQKAYVVGLAAPKCLIVATCWLDAEWQCQAFDRENPLSTVHQFDESLRAGDWCIVGYVQTESTGERYAAAIPNKFQPWKPSVKETAKFINAHEKAKSRKGKRQ